MIQIFIQNTDVDDLFATAIDKLTAPPTVRLNNQRINASQQVGVNVQEDGSGNCLLDIATVKASDPSKTKTFNDQSCAAGQTISVDVF